MRHLDLLADRFGPKPVLGGQCVISATLDADGAIVHLNDLHALSFGELDGSRSRRIETIASALLDAGFDARLSDEIRQEMWEKWVFIATAAGHNLPDALGGRRLRRRRRLGPRHRAPRRNARQSRRGRVFRRARRRSRGRGRR